MASQDRIPGEVPGPSLKDPVEGSRETVEHELARQQTPGAPHGQKTDRPGESAVDPALGDDAPLGTPGTGENTCRRCGGTGRLDDRACPECGGTGVVVEGIGGA